MKAMDQVGNKLNQDIFFCETCINRIKTDKGVIKCGFTEKSLRFYDRACDRYEPILAGQVFEWDKDRRMYVIR